MDKPPPIFGPNGSVLNSETMSDELREKYQPAREYSTKPKQIIDVLILLFAPLIIWAIGIDWFVSSRFAPENELYKMLIILLASLTLGTVFGLIWRAYLKSISLKP